VRTTIDIGLQQQIQQMFAKAQLASVVPDPSAEGGKRTVVEEVAMHGAAVVIDVKTGQVRALVSYPTYDLNTFDEMYGQLLANEIERPMLQSARAV
jgi:cell division protein FtsI/penicillin-binding protein 2